MGTLERLRRPEIKACLAHRFDDYMEPSLRAHMLEARERGLIHQFGVSLYHPEEARRLLDEDITTDLVQLPFNVFDQRFTPFLAPLKQRGVEIHVRSVFLQGLLLMDPETLPKHFLGIKERIVELRMLAKEREIPIIALLLNFVVAQPKIDRVVVGVTSVEELNANLAALGAGAPESMHQERLEAFAMTDEQVILPYNWR